MFIESPFNSFHTNVPFGFLMLSNVLEMEHLGEICCVKLKWKILNKIIWDETLLKKFNSDMNFTAKSNNSISSYFPEKFIYFH